MLRLRRTWSGRLRAPHRCEINAVDHCNIACLDCNHASPAFRRKAADPAVVGLPGERRR